MPDKFYFYEALSPADVFGVLAQFARQYSQHLDLLRVVTAIEDEDSDYVTLVLDDQQARPHGDARRRLSGMYEQVKGRKEINRSRLPVPTDDLVPLLTLLPRLTFSEFRSAAAVIGSEDAARVDELARAREDELLMLVEDAENERVAEIYQTLHDYARPTFVRTALPRSTTPGASSYTLFYIRNSDERVSGFDSAWSSGYFPDCIKLQAYSVNRDEREYVFFVPENLFPLSEPAALFAQFLLAAPHLFNVDAPQADPTAVFAIRPLHGDRLELLYLAGVTFTSAPEIDVRPPVTDVAYLGLADSTERLKSLRELLDNQAPDSGYRLHLRPTHYIKLPDNERDILIQQLQEIAMQLIELAILEQPQPRLYRFSQWQLPALADVLRVYLPDNLPATRDYLADAAQNPLLASLLRDNEQSPRIRYLFHANTDRDQAGVHYLLVDGSVVMNDIDPMAWWRSEASERPMDFWLDPLWALYYQQAAQKSLVFVPRGTRMHPVFHSWGVDSMHEYLRQVFGAQFDDALPQRPIYVFDGELGEGEDLYVEVLDQDKFAPITQPDVLSGLNKNLVILHRYPDTAELIERMADTLTRQRLEDEIMGTAQAIHDDFTAKTEAAADHFEAETASLLTHLGQRYDELVTRSQTLAEQARQMNERIAKLFEEHKKITAGTDLIQQVMKDTQSARDQMTQFMQGQQEAIDQRIARSDALQEKQRTDTQHAVEALISTRDNLDRLIHELQDYGRRRR